MIEVELLLVFIVIALCVIASELKKANKLNEKIERHLSGLKSTFSEREKRLELTPDDLREPRRERARV